MKRRPPPLSPRHDRIVRALLAWTRDHGFPPSWQQLAEALNYASANAIRQDLTLLRERGAVTWTPGVAHSLRVGKS